MESVWRRTSGKSFTKFWFLILFKCNRKRANNFFLTLSLFYFYSCWCCCGCSLLLARILLSVCQIIVWHAARVAGTAVHARMEFGAAKTSHYRARWQSKLWASTEAEEGELEYYYLFFCSISTDSRIAYSMYLWNINNLSVLRASSFLNKGRCFARYFVGWKHTRWHL